MSLYQATRLPRAHKAQMTSRQAGDVYEMQGPNFQGLTFEEGLQVIHDKFKNRMRWVWGHDLEADFNETKARLGLGAAAIRKSVKSDMPDTLVSVQVVAISK
jgi:salicylate hydroxylase